MIAESIRSLSRWRWAILVVLAAIAAWGTYLGYTIVTDTGVSELEEDQHLIPVRRSDLVDAISINGTLTYTNRESLGFGGQAVVGEILVKKGQRVEAGQMLARLDSETLASLEKAAAQARIDLRSAEEALAAVRRPPSAVAVTKTISDVAEARISVRAAKEALAALRSPSDRDLSKAYSAVADAQASHEAALDALGRLESPPHLNVAEAEMAVAEAELSSRDAQKALDALLEEASDDETADVQDMIASARSALATARADLDLTRSRTEREVGAAQAMIDEAEDAYRAVFLKWLGMRIDTGVDLPPKELLDSWGVDLEHLFDPAAQANALREFVRGQSSNDPSTPWNETIVYFWQALFPGTVAVSCKNDPDEHHDLCIGKEMADAYQMLQEERHGIVDIRVNGAKAAEVADKAVSDAHDLLTSRLDALDELRAAPDPLGVQSQSARVALAQAKLVEVEAKLAALKNDPDPVDLEVKRQQVDLTKADLDQTRDDLREIVGEVDPLESAAKKAAVDLAAAKLAEAEEALADWTLDELEIELREADVLVATAALASAIDAVDSAAIRAPWAGLIESVEVKESQQAGRDTAVLELKLVDPSVIKIDGSIDEIDVLSVQEGSRAAVTLDALPGQVMEGEVSEIGSVAGSQQSGGTGAFSQFGPLGGSQQSVVTYSISVRVEIPDGLELPEGLSALAQVVIKEEKDALLIPLQALHGGFDSPNVKVQSENGSEDRSVVLGISDNFWVVVEEGLEEGEKVVIELDPRRRGEFFNVY